MLIYTLQFISPRNGYRNQIPAVQTTKYDISTQKVKYSKINMMQTHN